MPVAYKQWFIKRTSEELTKQNGNGAAETSKGPNTASKQANMRQLQQLIGRQQNATPNANSSAPPGPRKF